MSPFAIDTPLPELVTLVARATALMGLAAVAVVLGRRRSAASRHWTITLALCGLLALPLLSGVLPSWTVLQVESAPAVPLSQVVVVSTSADTDAAVSAESQVATTDAPATPSSFTAWQAAVMLYVGTALALLLRLTLQFAAARRLVRQSAPLGGAVWEPLLRDGRATLGIRRPVRLLCGGRETMPMAMGAWNAAVVLPSVADEWTDERRRAVLLHELAHVARRDCLTQLLAGIACAVYWPHPGVWWLARRLRVERELACDDLVLRAGTPAMDYAGHLLDVAYTLGGARSNALAVGMARRSQLEGRMLAVLDTARNRALPGRGLRLAMAAAAMAALIPLAVATVSSEPLAVEAGPGDPPPIAAQTTSADVAPQPARSKAELKPAPWARAVNALAEQASNLVRGSGSWTISPSRPPGEVHLEMREGRSQSGRTMKLAALEGLTEAQLTTGGPVKFVLRRDAGTFTFEGTARDGHGGGTFSFAASQTFAG